MGIKNPTPKKLASGYGDESGFVGRYTVQRGKVLVVEAGYGMPIGGGVTAEFSVFINGSRMYRVVASAVNLPAERTDFKMVLEEGDYVELYTNPAATNSQTINSNAHLSGTEYDLVD